VTPRAAPVPRNCSARLKAPSSRLGQWAGASRLPPALLRLVGLACRLGVTAGFRRYLVSPSVLHLAAVGARRLVAALDQPLEPLEVAVHLTLDDAQEITRDVLCR
jgi:hypothetical protein